MSVTIFVQTIEKYPCLYNNTLSEYARKDITDKAWNEVAAVMKWSVADCKERWKNIRNGFVRSLKQPPSGSSAKQTKQYYLHDVMQFVLPYVKPVAHTGTTGNLPNPSHDNKSMDEINEVNEQSNEIQHEEEIYESMSESTNQSVSSQTFKKPYKKIKPCDNEVDRAFVNYLQEKKKPNNEDHRKMFLVSLLPEVNKLSDEQMREFKIKVVMLLDEILTRPRQDQASTQQIVSRNQIRSESIQEYRNCSPISSTESHVSQHASTPSPNFTFLQCTNIDEINTQSDTSNITREFYSL